MKNKFLFTCLFVFFINYLSAHYKDMYQNNPVVVCGKNISAIKKICNTFKKYDVQYAIASGEPFSDSKLYICAGLDTLNTASLPSYYIIYQTESLSEINLTQDDLIKLKRSIAIWDPSWESINSYKDQFPNYYYFPENYEYADPVILSCFLPVNRLAAYKDILNYSNINMTDISNHLPAMFVHGCLQEPTVLMEFGVATGQSTYALSRVTRGPNFKMIGIDIQPQFARFYKDYGDPSMRFFCMDDMYFMRSLNRYRFIPRKDYDIVFIDTSHLYAHTQAEIQIFTPLLSQKGMFLFHDTNMSPLENFYWQTLNNKLVGRGWDNDKGVIRPIKEYFGLQFDETKYYNQTFVKDGVTWKIIHYPFCNGLTLIKKL
jgi:hypothetical protein